MTLIKTKSRKPPKCDAIRYGSIIESAERISYEHAVESMSVLLNKRVPLGTREEEKCRKMLIQMKDSLNRHFRHPASPNMTDERRQECIRHLFIPKASNLFSVDQDRAFHNGYFVLRPKTKKMREPIYEMLATMKVLADNNDETHPEMVSLYQWIEMEVKQRTWV